MFKGIVREDSLYDADEASTEFQMSWIPHAKLCQQHLSEQKYELFCLSETPLLERSTEWHPYQPRQSSLDFMTNLSVVRSLRHVSSWGRQQV